MPQPLTAGPGKASSKPKAIEAPPLGQGIPTKYSGTNYDPRIQVFDKEFGPPEADLYKATNGQEGGFVVGAGGKLGGYSPLP